MDALGTIAADPVAALPDAADVPADAAAVPGAVDAPALLAAVAGDELPDVHADKTTT
ncbi:MAG: hypothetical protein QOH87_3430, partial [Trebonia sp.]|nr:hypothetical protein [Trebonia sp.]